MSLGALQLALFKAADAAIEGFDGSWPICGLTCRTHTGRLIAYGGVQVFDNHRWVFFKAFDSRIRRHRFLVHRLAVKLIREATSVDDRPLYALCDESQPRAAVWLQRLGFRPLAPHEKNASIRIAEKSENQPAWIREHRRGTV